MRAIWLACCSCGEYGLLQQEVEGRDASAQVLRVGDLDGLVSMARAFPSRRGAAIIAASLFEAEKVRKTVARLTSEGRVGRVVVLVETLDPSDIEALFRAGATEVIAAHSICGDGRMDEGADGSDRCVPLESKAVVDRESGAPLQEARVLVIVEKRKPSMIGAPGARMHATLSKGRRRATKTFRLQIWDTYTA